MKPFYLYSFYQLPDDIDEDLLLDYMQHLSSDQNHKTLKLYEFKSLKSFIRQMIENGAEAKDVNFYYYSFSIPQISKEFDLIKLGENAVLNVELKTRLSNYTKIKTQLITNRHYLSHLKRPVFSFVYIADTKKVFTLDSTDDLVESSVIEILNTERTLANIYIDDLEKEFRVSHFLVSPINSPGAFIAKSYFLTGHQEEIKKTILDNSLIGGVNQIIGGAGTGKTLLLYDLGVDLDILGNVCIIHCGLLAEGHQFINENTNLKIFPIKSFHKLNYSNFDYVLIDEAHRIKEHQLKHIIDSLDLSKKGLVFSLDARQVLSRSEKSFDIANKISLIPNIGTHKLTNKIRSNKELGDFIIALFDLNRKNVVTRNGNVEVVYAKNMDATESILNLKLNEGFTFINFTPSMYNNGDWERLPGKQNSHRVIGQEFDYVVVVMGKEFRYKDDGKLAALTHPNPDYLYDQMLYQAVTRVREKLFIIVNDNLDVFRNIMSIIKSANDT
jgi:hypothetical protein